MSEYNFIIQEISLIKSVIERNRVFNNYINNKVII